MKNKKIWQPPKVMPTGEPPDWIALMYARIEPEEPVKYELKLPSLESGAFK